MFILVVLDLSLLLGLFFTVVLVVFTVVFTFVVTVVFTVVFTLVFVSVPLGAFFAVYFALRLALLLAVLFDVLFVLCSTFGVELCGDIFHALCCRLGCALFCTPCQNLWCTQARAGNNNAVILSLSCFVQYFVRVHYDNLCSSLSPHE